MRKRLPFALAAALTAGGGRPAVVGAGRLAGRLGRPRLAGRLGARLGRPVRQLRRLPQLWRLPRRPRPAVGHAPHAVAFI